ncbi:response regulator transcription factor [Cohnella boryungensis]|uniref:Response regulator n=1 Tax=Cohnella boryungensis TaxID=768479 RepID=A0ABV8S6T7_9BACL
MNIFVAEDEIVALEEIEFLLQRYKEQHVIYTAQNAFQMMEMCTAIRPDILITDIRMPRMDGLELIAALKKSYPDMAAIILSGYGDFSYAQQGMQLGVKEYLVKPVEEAALRQAVDKLIVELQEAMDNKQKLSDWTLIREMLGQAGDMTEYMTRETFGIVMSSLGNEGSSETWDAALQLQAEELIDLPPGSRVLFPDFKRQCVLIPSPSKESIRYSLGDWATKIHAAERQRQRCDVHTTYFIKGTGETLHSAYLKGIESIGQQMRLESSTFKDTHTAAVNSETSKIWDRVRVLEIYLSKREMLKIRPEIEKIMGELKLQHLTVKELIVFTTDMLTALQYNFTRSLNRKIVELDEISSSIHRMTSYAELGDWLGRKLLEYISRLGTSKLDAKELVHMLMHQVKHAFEAPDSLQQFAKDHHVSVGYLSRVFKNELGFNFSDFVLEIRMEKARELLDMGALSLSEISRRVGYEDPKYFSQLFKKAFGLTPTDYSKQKKNSPQIGK